MVETGRGRGTAVGSEESAAVSATDEGCQVFHTGRERLPKAGGPVVFTKQHVTQFVGHMAEGANMLSPAVQWWGAGNGMWSSDFPHGDCTWPYPQELRGERRRGRADGTPGKGRVGVRLDVLLSDPDPLTGEMGSRWSS
jgi:hypothetical protein